LSALAIAWTLAHPAVDVALVGARQAAQIEASVGAAALAPDDIALAEIEAIMDGAVPVGGPTPESV
jgi:aryl-alcohol dehydrogenase-like predicted oxidoreductase